MARNRRLLKAKRNDFRKLTQMYEQLFPQTADRLWAVRNTLEMSQREFGEHCGLTASWVSGVECGYSLPKGSTLKKIVEATGLSADFLLGVDAKVNRRAVHEAERFLEHAADEMQKDPGETRKRERDAGAAADRLLERNG